MRYEPVGYIFEYEVGALIVYLIIMARYLGARRFPNQKNYLYNFILWMTLADVLLDVISSFFIDNISVVPRAMVYIVNALFYASSILMLLLMTVYTLALTERLNVKSIARYFYLAVPALIVSALLASNPLTHLFFYIDPLDGYIHGEAFFSVYVVSFVYLIITFLIALCRRKRMQENEFSMIMCFLAVITVATAIQYFIPQMLATCIAIMIAVILMYFVIQNPDKMRDMETNTFTYEAMMTFLNDCLSEKKGALIIAVDIANIARINDLFGADNGSQLLRQVSRFLQNKASDTWVFRMRGSTLVAVTRTRSDYDALAEQLNRHIALPWVVNNIEILLHATVCKLDISELPSDAITSKEVFDYLEAALELDGEDEGRIKHVVAGAELFVSVRRRRTVEAALREAIETGEGLELYYQPLWSVKEKCFNCAEVLLRFRHPTLGMISPDEFVSVAESRGLITALDEIVIRKACVFLKEYDHCRGLGQKYLEINLSALEFIQSRLPDKLRSIIEEYHIDPTFLCFEITETAATLSFELLKEYMTSIGDLGCRFALDDFGTGYANISQVIQLPFSTVKLDKSLLDGPPTVLKDLAHMFASMNCCTVVEGVETYEQVKLIESYALDYVQGFYYAKPMSQSEFIEFMERENS